MSRIVAVALLLWAGACGPTNQRVSRPTYERNAIVRAELASRAADDMFSVVRALRPNWLMTPLGASGVRTASTAPVTVYLDGKTFGPSEMLKSISAETVESARYYSVSEAQSRFGLQATSPVIDLVTRKAPR